MRFVFDLSKCADGNSDKAVVREAHRLACIAWCLQELGHDVTVPRDRSPGPLLNSPRYELEPFSSLNKQSGKGIRVSPEYGSGTVIIKTSVSTHLDANLLEHCDLLVAHEYGPEVGQHPRLLPVPFLVHDRVLEYFQEHDAILPYLRNELRVFRSIYRRPVPGLVGFCGYSGYGRHNMADALRSCLPSGRVDLRLSELMRLGPSDYLKTIGQYGLGLLPAGDTPKSNRHAELALLGIPTVTLRRTVRDTPDLQEQNCCLLDRWEDVAKIDPDTLSSKVAAADEAYRDGWSPLGIAQLIVQRTE